MIDKYESLIVGKYEKLLEARAKHGKDDKNALNLAILSILTDRSEDELLDLKIPDFRLLMDKARFLYAEPVPTPVAKCYKIKSHNLIPVMDVRKMTTAQYIDFQAYAQTEANHIAELLSCFLVPKGLRYNDGYDVMEVQIAIRECLSITQALGLLAFFLKRSQGLTISTLRSSIKKMKKMSLKKEAKTAEVRIMTEVSIALLQNGDGWRMSMPFLR